MVTSPFVNRFLLSSNEIVLTSVIELQQQPARSFLQRKLLAFSLTLVSKSSKEIERQDLKERNTISKVLDGNGELSHKASTDDLLSPH